jgi:hypothetical protein
MYVYFCKDANCKGHTKSWERCCDLRAFSASRTTSAPGRRATPKAPSATPGNSAPRPLTV